MLVATHHDPSVLEELPIKRIQWFLKEACPGESDNIWNLVTATAAKKTYVAIVMSDGIIFGFGTFVAGGELENVQVKPKCNATAIVSVLAKCVSEVNVEPKTVDIVDTVDIAAANDVDTAMNSPKVENTASKDVDTAMTALPERVLERPQTQVKSLRKQPSSKPQASPK